METASLLSAARRRWWVIVLLAILGGAVGAIPSSEKSVDATTTWTASHTMLLSNSSDNQSLFSDPIAFNQLQLFATTGEVPERVAKRLNFAGVPPALAAQVTVTVDGTSAALRISTTQQTGERAVEVADAFAEELISYLAERQDTLQSDRIASSLERLQGYETDIARLQDELDDSDEDPLLTAQLAAVTRQYEAEYEIYRGLQNDNSRLELRTLESAQPIQQTQSGLSAPTSRSGRGALAAIVGAIIGLGVAVLWARADRRLRSREQAEAIVGVRSQVSIPRDDGDTIPGVVVARGRHDALSDAYRTLRSVVGFVETGLPSFGVRAPVALVISAGPSDGKTSVSANLAAAFAESGRNTIAVNTDFRRPSLSERILGRQPERPGFFAEDVPDLPPSLMVNRTSFENLSLFDIAGAIGSPGDLARVTARVLSTLAEDYDAVVVDSSPVGATAEVLELVPRADVIILVVRIDHTYTESVQRTVEIVRTLTSAPMLLTIVGDTPDRHDYSYDYGAPKPGRRRTWPAIKARL